MILTHAGAMWVVTRREILEHVRSKRLIITGSLYFAMLIVGILLLANTEFFRGASGTEDSVRAVDILNLLHSFFLGFTFLSLLGIILMADTICGEWKDRTLVLFFTKPLTRWAALTGKLLGGLLAVYTIGVIGMLVGFVAGIILGGAPEPDEWGRLLGGMGWAFLGLLPFVALGTLMSVLFRSPTTSFIVGTLLKFVGFPILANFATIIVLITQGPSGLAGSGTVFFFGHVDPDYMLRLSSTIWSGVPTTAAGVLGAGERTLGEILGWGAFAIAVHTVLYLGFSYWIVSRRDYA